MKYSPLTARLDSEASYAWAIHDEGRRRLNAGEDMILLSVGDPDFETPPPIVEHAAERMRAGRTRYGPPGGEPALRAVIAKRHSELCAQAVEAESVVVFPGAQNALYSAMVCVAGEGDEVIVPEPRYVTYEGVVDAAGATRIDVPLRPETGFRLDPQDIRRAVTPNTRAILLNTPHNPTGMMMSRDELEQVAAIARAHDLWVISDEVYGDISFAAEHVAISGLDGMAQRTVTLGSLSKSHAMQGWRLGWAIAPVDLANHMVNLVQCMLFGTPPFTQDAALYALTQPLAETSHMKTEYARRRELVSRKLNECARISCHWPQGGMFLLIDIRATGMSDTEFAYALLNAEGVCVLPAATFGPSAEGHVRVSLTAPYESLEEACQRIARFTDSLAAGGSTAV